MSLQVKPIDGAYISRRVDATAAAVDLSTEESCAGRGRVLKMAELAELNETAKLVKLSEPNDLEVSGNISGCTHFNEYALE